MLSKQDKDGNVTILASSDQTVTGHGSDGRHTTFFTKDGGFRVRSFDQEAAGWFALSTCTLMVANGILGWYYLNSLTVSEAIFPLGFLCFFIMVVAFGSGRIPWKEGLTLLSAGALISQPIRLPDEETLIAFICVVAVLVGHGVSWVNRAVWEPFVLTVLFFVFLLLGRLVEGMAGPFTGVAFITFALGSFCFSINILANANAYKSGWNNMRE